jgi:hypothetical protein
LSIPGYLRFVNVFNVAWNGRLPIRVCLVWR